MDERSQALEALLLVLSVLSFLVQVCAWIWVRRLADRLEGEDGGALVGIISFLLGWILVSQAFLVVGLMYVDLTDGDDHPNSLSNAGLWMFVLWRIAFLLIVLEAWRRIRQFSREP